MLVFALTNALTSFQGYIKKILAKKLQNLSLSI